MLFPHLLLFPYQPAYDSASSASKLYKTQGKLPQRDSTLLFPLLLPLPCRHLFSPFSACHKPKCVPQHRLHVVGVQLNTNSMSSTGRFSLSYSVRKKKIVNFFTLWWKRSTWSFTKGHRWSSGLLSNLSFFLIITPFSENTFIQRLPYYHLVA